MKRFRYYILPRVCLVLSVLVLLFGLWVLWFSLGRPMPTRELACRQAETAHFAPHGRTVAAGDVRFQHTEPHLDAWVVRRAGGRFSVVELNRTAGLLWSVVDLQSIPMEEETLCVYQVDYAPVDTVVNGRIEFTGGEVAPLAICTHPEAARVEVSVLWFGDWETDVYAALEERGVTGELTDMGGGVWAGPALFVPDAPKPEGLTSSSSTLYRFCRAYDAEGNLLAVYDPTAG